MKDQALRILRDEIMPYLEKVPADGPRDAAFGRLMKLYKSGHLMELGAESKKALEAAALDKSTYGPLRLINRVLTASNVLPFKDAAMLRTALRDAGKGTDLIAADKAQALATFFADGSRDAAFTGLRGLMADAHPTWDAAARAYGTNARLFESRFIQNMIDRDPESVLQAVSGKAGTVNATRVSRLHQTLVALPQQFGDATERATGQRAWDALRAGWFRSEVVQDDVFGLVDRIRRVDPDVLRAWFPDVPGQQVMQRAIGAGRQFQDVLLREIADADPSQVVGLVGRTPDRITRARTALTAIPRGPQTWSSVKRAWLTDVVGDDLPRLGDRLGKINPNVVDAWLTSPEDRQAWSNLQRLGRALAAQRPIPNRGIYESVEAVTIVSSLLNGNLPSALKIAAGYEGVPALISWAVYQPTVQRYLLDASTPTLPVTTRTAALLRAAMAWRAHTETEEHANSNSVAAATQ